jgi:D-cysteine desulfhydrase
MLGQATQLAGQVFIQRMIGNSLKTKNFVYFANTNNVVPMVSISTLNMSRFPRFSLLEGRTMIEPLNNLGAKLKNDLGGVRLFVKRDDHMSLGCGGNKLRKLEFILGEALAQGVQTIITVGGIQSNHARLTAAAAARAGIKCELVLNHRVRRDDTEYVHNGNLLLDSLFGARILRPNNDEEPIDFAENRAKDLRKSGQIVYVCPLGGSTPLGSLGYALCAQEIAEQSLEMGLEFTQVVLANGSGGTHAGLAVGFAAMGRSPKEVKSYVVLDNHEKTLKRTLDVAQNTAKLLELDKKFTEEDIDIDDGHLGKGYGIPTEEMLGAVRIMAQSEGLLLDPVYSGKAFAGLLQDIRDGKYVSGQNVLFLMTGGVPSLFAYRSAFDDQV